MGKLETYVSVTFRFYSMLYVVAKSELEIKHYDIRFHSCFVCLSDNFEDIDFS